MDAAIIISSEERKFLGHYVGKILDRKRGALAVIMETISPAAQRQEVEDLRSEIAGLQALLDKLNV